MQFHDGNLSFLHECGEAINLDKLNTCFIANNITSQKIIYAHVKYCFSFTQYTCQA